MRKRKGWVDFNTTEENLSEKEQQKYELFFTP